MKPVFGHVRDGDHLFFRINKKTGYRASFLWHFHHVFELNLILKGNGTRFVGDHIAHYEDGDLVLMAPNLPHTWYADPRIPASRPLHDSIGIQFADNILGEGIFDSPGWQHIGRMLERSARGVDFRGKAQQAAMKRIVDLEKLQGPPQLNCFLSILDLLANSREYRLLSSEDFNPNLHPHNEKRIDRVCSYISQNYTRPLALEEVASIANLSLSAFSHFFRMTTGKTFVTYVNELRVGLSCKLLLQTDRSVADVAFESGFNNLSNFNRRFLHIKRVSPKEYRRQYLASSAGSSAYKAGRPGTPLSFTPRWRTKLTERLES